MHICIAIIFSVISYIIVTFLTDLIISISDYVMIRSRVSHVVFYCFATHVDLSLLIIVVENRYISAETRENGERNWSGFARSLTGQGRKVMV